MPGFGCAYSTSASVTAFPIAADFAFHLSDATSRKEFPHPCSVRENSGLEDVVIKPRTRAGEARSRKTYAFLRRGAAAGFRAVAVLPALVVFVFVAGAAFRLGSGFNSEGSSRLAVFHKRSRS